MPALWPAGNAMLVHCPLRRSHAAARVNLVIDFWLGYSAVVTCGGPVGVPVVFGALTSPYRVLRSLP